jgi:hypothetical protein
VDALRNKFKQLPLNSNHARARGASAVTCGSQLNTTGSEWVTWVCYWLHFTFLSPPKDNKRNEGGGRIQAGPSRRGTSVSRRSDSPCLAAPALSLRVSCTRDFGSQTTRILSYQPPVRHFDKIRSDLVNLGAQVIPHLREVASLATPPHLVQYNQWGQRIDKLITSESWRQLKAISQKEGIIGIFYERESGDFSRVHGFMKALMMVGDAQVVYCPLSMTDGCARGTLSFNVPSQTLTSHIVLELHGTPTLREKVFKRLVR